MKNYFLRWKFIAWVQIFDHINNDIFSSSGKNIIVFLYPNLLNANENKFVFKNKEKKFIKIIYLYAEQHNIYIYIYIDDAQKIRRLNVPGFNGLVVPWKAWKERNTK